MIHALARLAALLLAPLHAAEPFTIPGHEAAFTAVSSTSGLGDNIIIRGNHIIETRDAGIYIRWCSGVSIVGNTFASMTRPKLGAWIILDRAQGFRTGANMYPTDTPETQDASPRKWHPISVFNLCR